ncbi:MAG: sulfatase-like hydrolase/transferase [Kiritimatiellales bacterium]|nr:sulfatase-like hydrolase/transferase [Kiritimatiellales bacterium]
MNLKHIVLLGLLVGSCLSASAAKPSASRPNIIVMLIDDMGYECIGANGCTSYKTPVIDKLAATGVRFEHCYAQAICTPTRVQMMTGIYNVRNYVDFGGMDPNCMTFANILKQAGYATCMAGKWQLGTDVDLPKRFGFDENYLWWHTHKTGRYMNPGLQVNGVSKDFTNKEYGPDIVSDYALDFIQRKKDQPFFLYYTMMLTHGPYDATPDSADYGSKQPQGKRSMEARPDGIIQHFSDMVAYTDKLTGQLVAKLDELGIRDNTLLIILGDNGTGRGTMSLMGDRKVYGGKGMPTDAGMHVPLVVSWPGKSAVGTVSRDLVDTTDFLPTVCEAAGVAVPEELKIDGRSFLPQVRGGKGNPRDWYYCWYAPQKEKGIIAEFAAAQDFKLSRSGDFYDLRSDIEEQHPLKVPELTGEAAAAAKLLQGALDQYKDARPAALAMPVAGQKKGVRKNARRNKAVDSANAVDESTL